MRSHLFATALAALTLCAATAFADPLTLRTLEFGSWPAAVAALQANTQSQGATIHVAVVDSHGSVLACDEYSLTLDEISSQAFEVGRCDVVTAATEVRLVRRPALFDHDEEVPRPRAAGITALAMRQGGASGRAGTSGGSEIRCSVAVRPFVQDLEHGRRVFVTPGRYVLRTRRTDVSVDSQSGGWSLSAPATVDQGNLTIEYELFDTRHNEVVMHDTATLQCARASVASASTNDRDGDGIPDSVDACPDQFGGESGDPMSNGCPVPIAPRTVPRAPPGVSIESGAVSIDRAHVHVTGRVVITNGGMLTITNGGRLVVGDGGEAVGGDGATNREAVMPTIRAHMREIHDCYQRELALFPELRGRVDVSLSIDAYGRLLAVPSTHGIEDDPDVRMCVANVVRGLSFQPPVRGEVDENGGTPVTFSVQFAPR